MYSIFSSKPKNHKTEKKLAEKYCVIYTRSACIDQKEKLTQNEFQKQVCINYAKANTLVVKAIFCELPTTILDDTLHEFNRMLDYIKSHQNEISIVLMISIDRLNRDTNKAMELIYELNSINVSLITIN